MMAMEYPVYKIPFLGTNYYIKSIMLMGFAALGMLQAPTHTGALCLACASITYFKAAINGENGNTPPTKK
jgi:hypothetical protein